MSSGPGIERLDRLPPDIWHHVLAYLPWDSVSTLSVCNASTRHCVIGGAKELKFDLESLPPLISQMPRLESVSTTRAISESIAKALPRSLKHLKCPKFDDDLDLETLPSRLSSLDFFLDHSSAIRTKGFPHTLTSFTSTNWSGWTAHEFSLLPRTLAVFRATATSTWRPLFDEALASLPRGLIILEFCLGEVLSDIAIEHLPSQLQVLVLAPRLLVLTAVGLARLPPLITRLSLPTAHNAPANTERVLRGRDISTNTSPLPKKSFPMPYHLPLLELRLSSLKHPEKLTLELLPSSLKLLDLGNARGIKFSDHLNHLTELHTLSMRTIYSADIPYLPRSLRILRSRTLSGEIQGNIPQDTDAPFFPHGLVELTIQSQLTLASLYKLPRSIRIFSHNGTPFEFPICELSEILISSPPLFVGPMATSALDLPISIASAFSFVLPGYDQRCILKEELPALPGPIEFAPWLAARAQSVHILAKNMNCFQPSMGIVHLKIFETSTDHLHELPWSTERGSLPTSLRSFRSGSSIDPHRLICALPPTVEELKCYVWRSWISPFPTLLTRLEVHLPLGRLYLLSVLHLLPPHLEQLDIIEVPRSPFSREEMGSAAPADVERARGFVRSFLTLFWESHFKSKYVPAIRREEAEQTEDTEETEEAAVAVATATGDLPTTESEAITTLLHLESPELLEDPLARKAYEDICRQLQRKSDLGKVLSGTFWMFAIQKCLESIPTSLKNLTLVVDEPSYFLGAWQCVTKLLETGTNIMFKEHDSYPYHYQAPVALKISMDSIPYPLPESCTGTLAWVRPKPRQEAGSDNITPPTNSAASSFTHNQSHIWHDSNIDQLSPTATELNASNSSGLTSASFSLLPRTLTKLWLNSSQNLTDDSIALLPRSITELNLGASQLTDKCAPFFPPQLTDLAVRCNFSDAAIPHLPRSLRVLGMGSNTRLTDAGLAELPRTLERLNLLDNLQLTNAGMAALPRGLLHLNLYSNPNIDHNGVANLPPGLIYLNLSNANISDAAISHLPSTITELVLTKNNHISDRGLARMPPKLVHLRLRSNCIITGEGLLHLPTTLRTLNIDHATQVTPEDLHRAPPWLLELSLPEAVTSNLGYGVLFCSLPYLALSTSRAWTGARH